MQAPFLGNSLLIWVTIKWYYNGYERLWTCLYKGVEVKMVNGNAKSFLCVWEMKSLETLNQMKQIVVLKHWINNVTKIVLKHWTKWNKESLLLN